MYATAVLIANVLLYKKSEYILVNDSWSVVTPITAFTKSYVILVVNKSIPNITNITPDIIIISFIFPKLSLFSFSSLFIIIYIINIDIYLNM